MIEVRRILYPTDYSPCAEAAMHHAAMLAAWHEAELHVLHVSSTDRQERDPELRALQAEAAAKLKDQLPEAAGAVPVVTAVTRHPTAWKGICAYIDEHDIDLVVMGTQGRRGVSRLLLGSTAEEVVRRAHCPVLAACEAQATRTPRAVRSILIPADLSGLSRLALQYAGQLAQTYGARLDLVHVIEDATLAATYGAEAWAPDVVASEKRAQQALADLVLSEVGYEHTVASVRHGRAATEILAHAEEHDTDLIVIATHGRMGTERFLLGSVAEQVLRRAPCPVFMVKSTDKKLLPTARAREALEPVEKVTSRAK